MEQLESFVQKIIKAFEEKPIATTLKGLILLWVLKEIIKVLKS